MKRKHLLYWGFTFLLAIELCVLWINHKYGVTLIGNLLIDFIKVIIILIGLRIAIKEEANRLIYIPIFLCLLSALGGCGINLANPQFVFNSPNKTNALIIQESTTLYNGINRLYKKKYGIFKEELPNSPIGGYKPFSRGEYNIEWASDNEVTLFYEKKSKTTGKIIINLNKK